MKLMRKSLALPVLALLINSVNSLGKMWSDLKPKSYREGDELEMGVSRLWSSVRAPLPFDFYSLNWCESTAGHKYDNGYARVFNEHYDHNDEATENIHESPYSIKIGEEDGSKILCKKILGSHS